MQLFTLFGPLLVQIWEKGFEKTTLTANDLFTILRSPQKSNNLPRQPRRKKKRHKKFQSIKIFCVLLAI